MSRISTILAFFIFFIAGTASAQCIVNSLNGYKVHITIVPKNVVVSTADCPWGYNYNIALDYHVSFSGNNIPSSLYTLQTTIICNNQANSFFGLPLSGGSGAGTTTSNSYVGTNGTAYGYGSKPSCQQASVQTLNCGNISIFISGPGILPQFVSCNYVGGLPVELIDYTGETTEDGVALNWSTASEMRNDYFTVYRSNDGQTWTEAARIAGAGTTTDYNAYTWIDEAPQTGINYYKLTQTDLDGTVKEQGIVGVEYVDASASLTTVYPNPSTDGTFSVRVLTTSDAPVEVVLRDPLGRVAGKASLTNGQSFGNQYVLNDVVQAESGQGFYLLDIFQEGALIGHHKVEVIAQ